LREIRIDGRVEHQAVVENIFGIEADFALNVPVVETRLNGVAVIHTVQPTTGHAFPAAFPAVSTRKDSSLA